MQLRLKFWSLNKNFIKLYQILYQKLKKRKIEEIIPLLQETIVWDANSKRCSWTVTKYHFFN